MANEKEIKVNENLEDKKENATETVPAETMLDKVKKFRLGKTAKKILTGVGVIALAAVGTAIGVNLGKAHGENEETFDSEATWDQETDYDFASSGDEETEDTMAL